MKLKIMVACMFLSSSPNFCGDFPTTIALPKKSDYKPLPPGATFVFNNNNLQSLTMHEERKEVQTSITHQPPPIIVNPTPAPLPASSSAGTIAPATSLETNKSYVQGIFSWIKDLPNNLFTVQTGVIVVGTAALGYSVLWIKLLKHTAAAKKNNGWGSLQEHVPPQHLISIPLLSLAEGLIDEIKKKYPSTTLTDALTTFYKEADEESESLKAFLEFHEWLNYFKLSFIFPDQTKLITRSKLKIQRLALFKEALNHWINTNSARLIKNQDIPSSPLTFFFDFDLTRDETDVMELPTYVL